jgi:hypothetical protein
MNLKYRSSNLTSVYRIEVSDFMGIRPVSIPISYDASAPVIDKEATVSIILLRSVKIIVLLNNMSVFFPAGTFYEFWCEFWC